MSRAAREAISSVGHLCNAHSFVGVFPRGKERNTASLRASTTFQKSYHPSERERESRIVDKVVFAEMNSFFVCESLHTEFIRSLQSRHASQYVIIYCGYMSISRSDVAGMVSMEFANNSSRNMSRCVEILSIDPKFAGFSSIPEDTPLTWSWSEKRGPVRPILWT